MWVGHVLQAPTEPLARCLPVFEASHGLEDGLIWPVDDMGKIDAKSLARGLNGVSALRLPGWGPQDSSKQWLEAVADVASYSSQWWSNIWYFSSFQFNLLF